MNEENAVDISVIDTLKGLMKDRFSFLIDTFINKTATQIEDLKSAVSNNDTDTIISITHAMKGSSGSVGAVTVHKLSKTYEDNARSGEFDGADNWPDLLEAEYNRYKDEIQNHL